MKTPAQTSMQAALAKAHSSTTKDSEQATTAVTLQASPLSKYSRVSRAAMRAAATARAEEHGISRNAPSED